MANELKKKSLRDQDVRTAVMNAVAQQKATVIIDARPCSLEISRNAKGELSYSIKTYVKDNQELLESVKTLNMIETEIKKHFEKSVI